MRTRSVVLMIRPILLLILFIYVCMLFIATRKLEVHIGRQKAEREIQKFSGSRKIIPLFMPVEEDFLANDSNLAQRDEHEKIGRFQKVLRPPNNDILLRRQDQIILFGDDLNKFKDLDVDEEKKLSHLHRKSTNHNDSVTIARHDPSSITRGHSVHRERSLEISKRRRGRKWVENGLTSKILTMNNGSVLQPSDSIVEEIDTSQSHPNVQLPPFVAYGVPMGPGYQGNPYNINEAALSKEDKRRKLRDFDINYFDLWASNDIPVHRPLPDQRTESCKNQVYTDLPSASILIVFHNEAWTALLRTIHSILDTSPPELLKEIILLDDFSDQDHLKLPLETYLQNMTEIRLYRAKTRLGLIRARNEVFQLAKADVVVFLDSHIECFPGWLEPLLSPIRDDPKTVVFPTIESINPSTFAVGINNDVTAVGGLKLRNLSFIWFDRRGQQRGTRADYPESPTMPGGLYSISRERFIQLGMYDPGMDWWGGENLEISFKVWMCGGSILMSKCSHVGHIFRRENPNIRGVSLGFKNVVRLAEVWMDDYKHLSYEYIAYNLPDYGNVDERKFLRASLKCQNFTWYLANVYPELEQEIHDYGNYTGLIQCEAHNLCIDRMDNKNVLLKPCEIKSYNQQWHLTTQGHLVSGERLIGLSTLRTEETTYNKLYLFRDDKLSNTQLRWKYTEDFRLVHVDTGQCLHADLSSSRGILQPCESDRSDVQTWKMITREELHAIFRSQGVKIDWGSV